MFATITQYLVNPIFKAEFMILWEEFVAHLQRENYAISGTIHSESRISYISYLIWSSRDSFERIHNKEVSDFLEYMNSFDSYCNNINLLHRMEVIEQNSPSVT